MEDLESLGLRLTESPHPELQLVMEDFKFMCAVSPMDLVHLFAVTIRFGETFLLFYDN